MARISKYFFIVSTYMFIDVICMVASILIACGLRQATIPFAPTFSDIFINPINPFRLVFLFWIVIVLLVNNSHNLYQTRREIYNTVEIWEIIRSMIISALIIIVLIYGLKVERFPRTILVFITIISSFLFSLWRFIKRRFVEYLVTQGYNNYTTVIIGAGKVGLALYDEIKKRPNLGIKVIGFLDDFKTDLPEGHPPVLGKIDNFAAISRREFVNQVMITVHHDSQAFLKVLEEARDQGVAVRVVPQGFDLMPSEFNKFNIGFIPILEYGTPLGYQQLWGKSVFDFVSSFILTIFLLPVFLTISLLIKIDSPGPVFYFSRRFGRRGRIFYMIKFRSMVQDAPGLYENLRQKNEVDGPIFKIRNDPRITRVGKFLRKYSLDELPQILNVLKGEMSLVGPRPLPIDQIEKEDLKQLKRLEVKPGITGLWQIRGRSDISFSRLVKWDVWYISNWSFWLDLNILFQTLPVVIKGKGAY